MFTGEPILVAKNPETPFLFGGSMIEEGNGVLLVLAVGKGSFAGKIKMKIQKDQDDTPLQIKLTALAEQVGNVGMFAAIATFSAMLMHHLFSCLTSHNFFKAFFSFHTLD